MASYFLSVLFVKKLRKEIGSCIDYKRLNAITKKDRYQILLIRKIQAQLKSAKYLNKIDIRQVFYQIRISEDLKNLTTFLTRFDSFVLTGLRASRFTHSASKPSGTYLDLANIVDPLASRSEWGQNASMKTSYLTGQFACYKFMQKIILSLILMQVLQK